MAVVLITEEAIPPVQRFSLTQKIAEELADSGVPVYLISVRGRGEFKHKGVVHVSVDVPGWNLFAITQRIRANLKLCAETLWLCRRNNIKAVYGWWPIVFFARYAGGIRNVAADMPEFMDVMYRSFRKPLPLLMGAALRIFQKAAAKACKFIVTESDIARAVWCSRGVPYEKTYALPYGVEADVFSSAKPAGFRLENNIKDDEIMILYHGDIGIDDGVDVLIRAANNLPVKVVLAGGGERKYMNYLRTLAASNILFTGWIPYSIMPEVVASADICAAPFRSSLYTNSTCPLKPMEAMAAGKALVVSDLHTFSGYVADGVDCRLVRPGDVDSLRSVISELISNPEERRRLGENAKKSAREKFDWRIRVKKEASILIELAAKC
ncbi:MAG: glycosyltransferase [Nitrospirae bacterium]|nr:glycosyltransferase [Nitrospirota bacterium]